MNIPRPNQPRSGLFTAVFWLWVAGLIFNIALLTLIGWVAHHFISKYW